MIGVQHAQGTTTRRWLPAQAGSAALRTVEPADGDPQDLCFVALDAAYAEELAPSEGHANGAARARRGYDIDEPGPATSLPPSWDVSREGQSQSQLQPQLQSQAQSQSLPPARDRAAPRAIGVSPHLLLDLMHEVQARCPVAFARLYRLTNVRLFGVILRINRDRAESEDLLQDVYVKVWQQCGRFDARHGEVGVWLAAVAHNTAISSLRRRGCRPQQAGSSWWPDAEDAIDALPCTGAGPVDQAMRSQAAAAVQQSLRRLSKDQREGLSLAFFEGLSHQEIAVRLDRPLGSVKSMLRRALLALRPSLRLHGMEATAG